jgi:site-specific DNA recombinase
MSMPALRVALYARVSSEQQTEQGTIASQVTALEVKIVEDGLHLEPDHRFIDEGYSGATLVRPALERLRDRVAAGAVDRVYVHSPDRLARRYAYQVLVIDELQRLGVEIIFLNRAIGLSPEDDLLLQVQGMVAEYERAKILERSRRGKRHAAHQGRISVLSGAPYGYRYIGKHEGGGVARYAIDEAEAPAVCLMFQWIGHDRLSIGEVCRRLQQQGCLTRSGKSAWDRTTVWGILKNPAYIGAAAFGKTRIGAMRERLRPVRGGAEQPRWPYSTYDVPEPEWLRIPVPALIEHELFTTVQEQLAENRQRNRQNRRGQRYLLQGLLVCRRCGYAYYGKAISPRAAKGKQRDYAYYRCCGSDAHRFGGQRLCANPQLRTDRAAAAVWQEVQRLLQNPDLIAAEYERRLHQAQHPDANHSDLVTTEAQIAKLRRGVARLIDGYAEGLIEKDEFEQRITGLRQRIKVWEQQVAALQDEAALHRTLSLLIGRLEDFAKQIQQRMTTLDWSLQRDLIRLLVKRVEVDHDEINVVFRVAPPAGFLPLGPEGDRSLQDCWRRAISAVGERGTRRHGTALRSRGRAGSLHPTKRTPRS